MIDPSKVKKVSRLSPGDWWILKSRVLARDDNKCVVCSSFIGLQVDHKVPLRLGGTNDESNLQTLCEKCHSLKTKKDVSRIRRYRLIKQFER